jgi:hypothetical protein
MRFAAATRFFSTRINSRCEAVAKPSSGGSSDRMRFVLLFSFARAKLVR